MEISYYIQKQYINRISASLPLFKWNSQKDASFRCIICGDSKKSKTKKRGCIYEQNGQWYYKCHNCGVSTYFTAFLKEYFSEMYREMLLENAKGVSSISNISFIVEHKEIETKHWESFITPLSDLGPDHDVILYVKSRKIPSHHYRRLYYTEDFHELYHKLTRLFGVVPEKDVPNTNALLFPFVDCENNLMFLQARFFSDEFRYLTVRFKDVPKLFGLEQINLNKKVFVFEGAIDSLFVNNSVATADADLTRATQYIKKENLVLVYDNEPRSVIACRKIERALKAGFSVVIYPEHIKSKDINLMYLDGLDVQRLVEENHYKGMMGLLKFQNWKKC